MRSNCEVSVMRQGCMPYVPAEHKPKHKWVGTNALQQVPNPAWKSGVSFVTTKNCSLVKALGLRHRSANLQIFLWDPERDLDAILTPQCRFTWFFLPNKYRYRLLCNAHLLKAHLKDAFNGSNSKDQCFQAIQHRRPLEGVVGGPPQPQKWRLYCTLP